MWKKSKNRIMQTRKKLLKLGIAVTAMMAVSSGNAHADNTLSYAVLDKDGQPGEAQKMMIKDGKVRVDVPGGKNAMIFDANADSIYILELDKKKYMEMDPEMFSKLTAGLSAMQAQLQEKLAGLPEAQRAQMAAMMSKLGQGGILDGGKAPEIKHVETGRREKVGDYEADVVEVTEDGEKTAVYYVVNRENLKVGETEYAALQKFQGFIEKLMKSLPDALKEKMKLQSLMTKQNRLPVRVDQVKGQSVTQSNRLLGVSDDKLEAALFTIPEDFQKRENPLGAGGVPGI